MRLKDFYKEIGEFLEDNPESKDLHVFFYLDGEDLLEVEESCIIDLLDDRVDINLKIDEGL